MRKSSSRSARSPKKKGSRSKRARLSLPAAFKIVPIRLPARAKPRRKTRTMLMQDPNPCPPNCTCNGWITVGEIPYWVCVYPDGSIILIRKN